MVEDSLWLVVWVILGTQHLETTLELINVDGKILVWRNYSSQVSSCFLSTSGGLQKKGA